MARSLLTGSFIALVGATTLMSCSSDPATTTTSSTSSAASSGAGGAGGEASASASSSGNGGAGGQTTSGNGGAGGGVGGAGGAGVGGSGGSAGVGGSGGSAGVGGSGGSAGVGGSGGSAPALDQDGDGWTTADGDCCDTAASGDCEDPELVNPGAFEYLGNMVDDDCDGSTADDKLPALCSTMPLQTPTSSQELVQAMDLCNFTTESPALPDKRWGVISTALLLADGSANIPPPNVQVGVLGGFGLNVAPKNGDTMAAISSGSARDENDPSHVYPQNGNMGGQAGNYNANTKVGAPPAYLAAHGNSLPSTCGPACNGTDCTKAFDSVNLKLRIRVPTNAKSFSYNFKFYTAEYPEFTCQVYNDFFVTLLKSDFQKCPPPVMGDPCIPVDRNIATDSLGNPVSVNNAFLEVCFPPPGAPMGTCPGGTQELVGTGFGGWNGNLKDGGATVWLTNDASVVPGETIELEFILFDAGDHNVDSLALIDKFRWKINPSQTGVHK